MFTYGVSHCKVEWNLIKILTVIFMLIGGCAVFSGLFLIYASLCFFTMEGLEFMNILTDGAREYGRYPVSIYGKKALLLTTFLIPYALVQYYPLLYLLEKDNRSFLVVVPLLAVWFLIPSYALWRFGVRHYQSSGS